MTAIDDIDIFITAGGKSSRMGRDKGLIEISGKPMILHIMEMLKKNNFFFSIIANSDAYDKWSAPMVRDIIPGKGPMGALHTAFHYSDKKYILLLGCDSPFLPPAAIHRLIANTEVNFITVAKTRDTIHPLQAIYPASLKNKVQSDITRHHLKMQEFIFGSSYTEIEMDDLEEEFPNGFINFNEPKDILKWQTQQ